MYKFRHFAASGFWLSLAFGCAVSHADSTVPPASTAGVWQKHEYSFAFLGFTTTYSCDGLADKLKTLLIASGARADVNARPGACASGFGHPDKFARANLVFYTLSPVSTAAAVSTPAAVDETPIGGMWRTVSLTARSPRTLALGDCELIEQFKTNVLPMFSTRNVLSRTTCVPHQDSGSVIDLKFDAFAAQPVPGTAQPPLARSPEYGRPGTERQPD